MHKQVIAGIVLSLLAAGATPALAQSQPFQGLFGARPEAAPKDSLDLTTSLFGVHDTNLPRLAPRNLLNEAGAPEVRYSDLHTGIWYTHRGER